MKALILQQEVVQPYSLFLTMQLGSTASIRIIESFRQEAKLI